MKATQTARNKEVAGATNTMTKCETARLTELEGAIDSGLKTFLDVGRALKEINDGKLYRDTTDSFEKYVNQRFNVGRAYAYRLMSAAEVDETLGVSPIGDKRPINETQFRELAKVKKDRVCEVWQKAVEAAERSGEAVTAKLIKNTVEKSVADETHEQPYAPEGEPLPARFQSDEALDEEEEPDIEEEPTIEEICEGDNKAIESFCRAIVKQFEKDVPRLPWTEDNGRIDSALASVRAGLNTLRGAKSMVCTACVEGRTEKGKCRYCKGHGYLPVYQANAIPADARL